MKTFVDTNILVYAHDTDAGGKHDTAKALLAELWDSRSGSLSTQVLQEFYANVTRKCPPARDQVQAEIHNLLSWRPVSIDAEILESSWKIQERYQLSFWDSLIVAAAKGASCRYLLTEDMQADQDLGGVLVVNPFRSDPAEILNK